MEIGAPGPVHADRAAQLMEKARELEAVFLSEMLSHTGLDASGGEFGGGIGAEQFASLMRQEQARIMVDDGGIGLAEAIFESMIKMEG